MQTTIFIYVCVCTHTYLYVCVCVHICMCRDRGQPGIWFLRGHTSHFAFLRQGQGFLTFTWNSLVWLGWLAREPLGVCCFHELRTDVMSFHHCPVPHLYVILGIKLGSTCFQDKHFTHWIVIQAWVTIGFVCLFSLGGVFVSFFKQTTSCLFIYILA